MGCYEFNIYKIYNHSLVKPFTWDQFATFSLVITWKKKIVF